MDMKVPIILFVVLAVVLVEARVLEYEPRKGNDVTNGRRHANDVTYDLPNLFPQTIFNQDLLDLADRLKKAETELAFIGARERLGLASTNPPRTIPPRNKNDAVRLPANQTRKVLIIGGGLAGMSAALELAERGYTVNVREAGSTLGGRLASRDVSVNGTKFSVDNSFVSWMANNYQFLNIVKRLNISDKFTKWTKVNYHFNNTYKPERIYNTHSYPFDITSILWRSKNVKILDVIKTVFKSGDFVHFDYDSVYEKFDNQKFADWVVQQNVPNAFYDVFLKPIARELHNDDKEISTAEMLTYFYLYYLSTPQTTEADRLIPNLGNKGSLIGPWQDYLSKKAYKQVKFEFNKPFDSFNFATSGKRVTGDLADGEEFDYVVLATGPTAARTILTKSRIEWSGLLPAARALDRAIDAVSKVKVAPAYGAVRLWLKKLTKADRPAVIFTPDMSPLNAIVLLHLSQRESRQWAQKNNGSVVELQLSPMTSETQDSTYLELICSVLKEFCGNVTIVSSTKKSFDDIPSLEVGQGRSRPNVNMTYDTGIENLFLAGDWLKTSYPSPFGECAINTGREAANQILFADHVREATMIVPANHGPGWF